MSEYRYIQSLYKKHDQYIKRVLVVSGGLLFISSVFVWLDVINISPMIIYLLSMSVALYYANKTKVISKDYRKIVCFVEEFDKKLAEDAFFMFFLDYQLQAYFKEETKIFLEEIGIKKKIKQKNGNQYFGLIINEVKEYYDYLEQDIHEKSDDTLSLEWYQHSFDHRKKDLV